MEYICPKCDEIMEEVEFSCSGYAAPNGDPGLICFQCDYRLCGGELDDYLNDYDSERKEDEINNLNNRSS